MAKSAVIFKSAIVLAIVLLVGYVVGSRYLERKQLTERRVYRDCCTCPRELAEGIGVLLSEAAAMADPGVTALPALAPLLQNGGMSSACGPYTHTPAITGALRPLRAKIEIRMDPDCRCSQNSQRLVRYVPSAAEAQAADGEPEGWQ